ncbi:MAG: ArgE/DapE family deacylase [Candidatus Latescibacteria bacterium]|nr:ArgE/DapE family deacylase [Candidatus Latescibacterota bacterium]
MADIDVLLSKIDDDEVIQVTRDMVAIPSITHHEGMEMVNYLERWFKDLKIPMRIYPYDENRANFFADYGTDSGPGRFMFNGHQDIKPVDGMTVDPYAGEIRDGKMYGRGTCDMKGGIAGVLCAYKAMVRAGIKPKGGISFFSDIEEEFGGQAGYYWARREGHFNGYEGLISCEPTELEIQIGNRGAYAVSFATKGRSAHSGLAHLGVNAIHNMALFINEYRKLPYLQVENPWFGKPTVNFEKIEGGLYLSAVPDRCQACVDSRLIPETPPELVQKQVDELMERLNREHGINVSEVPQPEGWRSGTAKNKAEAIPADHPFTLRVAKAFKQALGTEPVIGGCPAVTIAMVLIERGIPAVICGPGSISKAHTEDEFVPVDELLKAPRIYAALMANM